MPPGSGAGDVLKSLEICDWIWTNYFRKDNSEEYLYGQFGRDIQKLRSELEELNRVVNGTHVDLQSFVEDSKHIAGDFLKTLETCHKFLNDDTHIRLNKNRAGFIQSVVWNPLVQERADSLRSQLQSHTQALALVTPPADTSQLLVDIHGDISELIERHRSPRLSQQPGAQDLVPEWLDNVFREYAALSPPVSFPDLDNFPLRQGCLALYRHFSLLSKEDGVEEAGADFVLQYLGLLKCHWLVNVLQGSRDFQSRRPGTPFPRFISNIGIEVCQRIQARATARVDLMNDAELKVAHMNSRAAFLIWDPPEDQRKKSLSWEEHESEEEVLSFPLTGDNKLVILKNGPSYLRVVSTSERNGIVFQSHMMLNTRTDKFIPYYAVGDPTLPLKAEIYIQKDIASTRYELPDIESAWGLQQAITGYRVRADQNNVTWNILWQAHSSASFFFPRFRQQEMTGRVHLWQWKPLWKSPPVERPVNVSALPALVLSTPKASTKSFESDPKPPSPRASTSRSITASSIAGYVASKMTKDDGLPEGNHYGMPTRPVPPAIVFFGQSDSEFGKAFSCLEINRELFVDEHACRCATTNRECRHMVIVRHDSKTFKVKQVSADGDTLSHWNLLLFGGLGYPEGHLDKGDIKHIDCKHLHLTFPTSEDRENFALRLRESIEIYLLNVEKHDRLTREATYYADRPRWNAVDNSSRSLYSIPANSRPSSGVTSRLNSRAVGLDILPEIPTTTSLEWPFKEQLLMEKGEEAPADSGHATGASEKSAPADGVSRGNFESVSNAVEVLKTSELTDPSLGLDSQDPADLGLWNADTTYYASQTSTLPPLRDMEGYINDLATALFTTVNTRGSDLDTLTRVSELLPDLLRAFSLKLGCHASSVGDEINRDLSFFIHERRRHIQRSFENMLLPGDAAHDAESADIANRLRFRHLTVSQFVGDEPDVKADLPPSHEDLVDFAREDKVSQDDRQGPRLDIDLYRESVVKTPAYDWLLATLRRESATTRAAPDLMEVIRETVLGGLPSHQEMSRRAPPLLHTIALELSWDPLSFVREQEYTEDPDVALERAITLTGSVDDGQALTAGRYLLQTWPTTGKDIMLLVSNTLRDADHHATCHLPDGTAVDARIVGNKLIVAATGIAESIAEVTQQFAWLGAALRTSPFESGIATCSPCIRNMQSSKSGPQDQTSKSRQSVELFCEIDFEMCKTASPANKTSTGRCWFSMFRNPVVVNGYPVLARREKSLGLEMPLNMMAGLTGSNRANEFDNKIIIKGFSAILVAIKRSGDLIVWHYLCNTDGERIAFFDHSFVPVDDIDLLQLRDSRHVVGWCKDCRFYAGAADALYNVDGTGLPPPHRDCLLEKVSISGGSIITGGVQFAVGVKDVPLHLGRNGYILKLKWMATKYVVLWDEADKRGWLVNGTSALLHLVRAWLHHSSQDDFAASFLFDPAKMKDAGERKPNSASRILADPDNRELVIYPGKSERCDEEEARQHASTTEKSKTQKQKTGYFLFEDLVEQQYNLLEQIIDHQMRLAGRNGVKLKTRVRKHLEGWDFAELATDHDPYPRVATLQALGYGWVDFVRSIGAITLLGRGFGDIIQPTQFDGMCSNWRRLPTQKYYLAVSVFDLEKIMRKFGDSRAEPPRLVHDLLWYCPKEVIAPCQCRMLGGYIGLRQQQQHHHDPVQIMCPTKSRLITNIRGPGRLQEGGAVVFGHNIAWGYRWKEKGDEGLEAGQPLAASRATEQQPSHAADTTPGPFFLQDGAASLNDSESSSHSRESTTAVTTPSPLSANSSRATPVELIADSAQSRVLEKPQPTGANPGEPGSSHKIEREENRARMARQEKRRQQRGAGNR